MPVPAASYLQTSCSTRKISLLSTQLCFFKLRFIYLGLLHVAWSEKVKVLVIQSCPTLWPHGLQPTRLLSPWNSPARILEWVAIPFSRECSRPRDGTWVSHITGRFFTIWATREAHAAYGILIPWPGITPGPLKWKPLVLTPGPPGNSPMSRYCYLQISYLITLMYLLVYI